ncbi:MAG: DUF2304 domain-containing protein [Lachnospiraceae bacterium]
MSIAFRVILIIVSIVTLLYMIRKIRQSKLQIEHALFWVIFAVMLVVLGIFPQIAIGLSKLLGLQSPANLVFLFIIFILMVRLFQMTLEISKLEDKLKSFIQHEAIREYKEDKKEQ